MRLAANITLLFAEHPFAERFERAAAAGFKAVELWWPGSEHAARVPELARAAGVEVALMNFDAGDMAGGDRGLLSDPAREEAFRDHVAVALEIAAAARCTRLNALVGLRLEALALEDQLSLARENVQFAADAARDQGAQVLIEAVNTIENGPYLLSRTAQAAEFVAGVERENVALQYDAYHMQRMEGNLVATIEEHFDRIAHVQVADSPGRNEPGTGEIDYGFVLGRLEELGYGGYVALEYRPSGGDTLASLRWLPTMREQLGQ